MLHGSTQNMLNFICKRQKQYSEETELTPVLVQMYHVHLLIIFIFTFFRYQLRIRVGENGLVCYDVRKLLSTELPGARGRNGSAAHGTRGEDGAFGPRETATHLLLEVSSKSV